MANAPTTVGPYELIERLGAGGMAETFIGLRRGPAGFEQKVCVKRILPAFEGDAVFVRQFLQEARVSAGLRHTNIAQVLDFGLSEGSHYLALELIDGMDLARLLKILHERGDTLTSGLVSLLAFELGTALLYAHEHASGAVLHRDISPSNVLVSRAGEIKLTDFGIAKAASTSNHDAPQTTTGTIKGKVPYMAAEYALSGRFEPRSDLFALGVLLYESLAGRRPFIGNTDLDTLHRIMKGDHPPLASLCPTAPPALVVAIEKLLVPEPEARFPNAAALLDALIEVAPPPTARRILGQLVIRAAEDKPWNAGSVERIEGTVAISDAIRLPEPVPAPPSAQTRTRVPSEPHLSGIAAEPPHSIPPPDEPLPETKLSSLEEAPTRSVTSLSSPQIEAISIPASTGTKSQTKRNLVVILAAVIALSGLMSFALLSPGETSAPEEEAIVPLPPITAQQDEIPVRPSPPQPTRSTPVLSDPPPAVETPTLPQQAAMPVLPREEPPEDEGETEREASGTNTERTREPSSREQRASGSRRHRREASPTPAPAEATTESPEERRETAASARLRITVTPWGHVWIDGRPMGRAPIDVPLSAGTHRIGIGAQTPSQTRTIRLRAGETQQLDLELTPP